MQDDSLWACLAGMAAAHKELSTAEIAYAAIDEVNIDGILRCNIVIRQHYYVAILSYVNIITLQYCHTSILLRCNIVVRQYYYMYSLFASGYCCCSLFAVLICIVAVSLEEALNLLSLMTTAHVFPIFCLCLYI